MGEWAEVRMDWSRAGGSVAIEEVALGWPKEKDKRSDRRKIGGGDQRGRNMFRFSRG